MGKYIEIFSFSNPKIKEVKRIREKGDKDFFLIEGYREIKRAWERGYQIRSLFFSEEHFLGKNEYLLIEKIDCIEKIQCFKDLFAKISYRDRPDGLLAISYKKELFIKDLEEKIKKIPNPFLLIAEGIEKPGNLGSMLRTCDAAGVDGIIICDKKTDIFNPNVVRSSIGTLFAQDIFLGNSLDVIDLLKRYNISIISSSSHAKKIYTEVDLKKPLAIVVGTEQYGLSEVWKKYSDIFLKIPMLGDINSLNVSAATAVLLYEVLRQRH